MKFWAIFAITLGVALAAGDDKTAEILSYTNDIEEDGSYRYSYELSNGIGASEQGVGGVNANGNFKYDAPDGTPVQLTYTADENGFQPSGPHLPTAPETPPLILKALEYLRAHPPQP